MKKKLTQDVIDKKNITNEIPVKLNKPEWRIIGGEKKWIKRCPKCKTEHIYCSKFDCFKSFRKNKKCLSCTKKGAGHHFYNKSFSIEHRKKLGDRTRNTNLSDSHKLKISISIKNKFKTDVTYREKILRGISKLNRITNFNKKSCKIFDQINNKLNWGGQHAGNIGEKKILNYSIDYFEPNHKIIIEWDERKHLFPYQIKKDKIRQNNILNELGQEWTILRWNEIAKTWRVDLFFETKTFDSSIKDIIQNIIIKS